MGDSASEKRKHIRVEHTGAVEFVSGDRTFQGTTINISRNGMQVVVNLPISHDSIRSMAFQLPESDTKVPIPCRLVRSSGNGNDGEQILGIEFQYEAEAQLLLIEKFMQESVCRASDFRQVPRTACRLQNVEIDRQGIKVRSIDNLSTEGGLISFRGTLHPGDAVTLQIILHDDLRRLRLPGEVVYVLEKAFERESAAGIRFRGLRVSESTRLRNLIIACCSGSTLSEMHQLFRTRATSSEHRISGGKAISHILSELYSGQVSLSLLVEGSLYIQERSIDGLQLKEARFTVRLPTNGGMPSSNSGKTFPPAYFAFFWKGSSHYFKAIVAAITADRLELRFPEAIFRSDKRSYKRKTLELSSAVQLRPESGNEFGENHDGVLLDISRRGFLCEIPLVSGWESLFAAGQSLRYVVDHRLGLGAEGQIRHIQRVGTPRREALQIGVEAGVASMDCRLTVIPPEEWSVQEAGPQAPRVTAGQRIESLPVSFRDKTGQVIRGLLNITHPGVPAPAVIIPPSYGKKKEAFAPLAATLLANACARGKPLAVLRFDGVNRPGESHNDVLNPRMGYEMLSYRISQGLADLQAAVEYVKHNDLFTAERTILITFSMSSLDARKLLSQHPRHGVDFWISCMGAPSAQGTLRNLLGGIDIVSNARMGVSNGLMGMLGHLINMDILAQDLLDRKYAFLTDARFDMAKISIPVLWISGQYDKWVEQAEVRNLMSVRAEASREVLEIPSGHNLRTSDDAIRAFKLMAAAIHRELYKETLQPCDPDKQELVRLITAERERLSNCSALPSMPDFWRGYLIGNERNRAGYDFYRNIEEFAEFLRVEAQLLELRNRETVADLGCGTGIFLEALLRHLARQQKPPLECDIQAFDLVPEALEKAQSKCLAILEAEPSLRNLRISFRQGDLEPNRLLPVARLLESPHAGLEGLRDRIGGLTSAVLDRLQGLSSAEVRELLLGSNPEPALLSLCSTLLSEEELDAVLDINLAARFLRHRLSASDLKSAHESDRLDYQNLRADDLAFRALDFGGCGSQLAASFAERRYTTIVASLFISYLFNPQYLLEQCFQALAAGGRLLVSSMRPDSDISVMFSNYIQALQRAEWHLVHEKDREENLSGARAMLNEAASLFELEESGFFRFYTAKELYDMLCSAGFERVTVRPAMGSPPQAFIAIGFKP